MDKRIVFLLGVLVIAFQNCKAPATERYHQNSGFTNVVSIDSLNYSDSEKLEIDKRVRRKLIKQNLSLHYLDSYNQKTKLNSNYNTYSLEIEKVGEYQVEIESLCSCFGENKFVFIPLISLENKNITSEISSTEMLGPSFSLPARLNRTWKIKVDEPGVFNFSVYSDNSNLDMVIYESSSISHFMVNGYMGYVPIDAEIKAGFKGKYLIKIKKI